MNVFSKLDTRCPKQAKEAPLRKWEIFQAYLVEPDQGNTAIGLAVVARK